MKKGGKIIGLAVPLFSLSWTIVFTASILGWVDLHIPLETLEKILKGLVLTIIWVLSLATSFVFIRDFINKRRQKNA